MNVLVTGGSRGIGAAIVRRFTANGHRVAFTYCREAHKADAVAKETGAYAICADALSEVEVLKSVEKARDFLGQIDILVNNAAISSFSLFTDLTTEEWNRFLTVNLTAPFLYTRECLPDMIHQKFGRIINISSVWGISGASCEVHYSTTKAGLIGMTRALAKEVGPSNITVNCVAPGVIDTDMNQALPADVLAELAEETPLSRIGMPDEVASCVCFLASQDASFVTGQILSPNGGFLI